MAQRTQAETKQLQDQWHELQKRLDDLFDKAWSEYDPVKEQAIEFEIKQVRWAINHLATIVEYVEKENYDSAA
jgi:hypothetical protein